MNSNVRTTYFYQKQEYRSKSKKDGPSARSPKRSSIHPSIHLSINLSIYKTLTSHGPLQETHLATVVETLQSIKASDMSPLISRIYASENGPETLDVLMKYLYKGMAQSSSSSSSFSSAAVAAAGGGKSMMTPQATGFSQIGGGGGRGMGGGAEGGGQAMSVLLSWHERLVEIAGLGSVVRVMTDRRTV